MKNTYSDEKLQKIKSKFPALTYRTYLHLTELGLNDVDIKRMHNLSSRSFQYFKNGHTSVLGGLKYD